MNQNTDSSPKCGREGKRHLVKLKGTSESKSFISAASLQIRREFFEKNPKIKWLTIAIGFGSCIFTSILGLFLSGLVGALVGLVIGLLIVILSYLFVPPAVTKVREIEH